MPELRLEHDGTSQDVDLTELKLPVTIFSSLESVRLLKNNENQCKIIKY